MQIARHKVQIRYDQTAQREAREIKQTVRTVIGRKIYIILSSHIFLSVYTYSFEHCTHSLSVESLKRPPKKCQNIDVTDITL